MKPQAMAEAATALTLRGGGGLPRVPLVLRAFGEQKLHHLAAGHGLEHHRHHLGRHAMIRRQLLVTRRLRSSLPLALLYVLRLRVHFLARILLIPQLAPLRLSASDSARSASARGESGCGYSAATSPEASTCGKLIGRCSDGPEGHGA
jgi:hypothetical protein